MRGLALGIVIAAGACHPTTQSEIDNVCTIVCRCQTPLPGEQQQCITQCENPQVVNFPDAGFVFIDAGFAVVDAPFAQPAQPAQPMQPALQVRAINNISDQCVECVYEHETSCSTLIANCNALCDQNPEPEPGTP